MPRFKTLVMACAFLSLGVSGHAQTASSGPVPAAQVDPARRDAAQAVMNTMHLEDLQRQMLDGLRNSMVRIIVMGGKSESLASDTVDNVLIPEMKIHLPEMAAMQLQVMAGTYTLEELKALQSFYSSPVGQSLLSKQVAVTKQMGEFGTVWGQQVARDALAKHADELRKRGITL